MSCDQRMADTGGNAKPHQPIRVPDGMWQAFGRVCKRLPAAVRSLAHPGPLGHVADVFGAGDLDGQVRHGRHGRATYLCCPSATTGRVRPMQTFRGRLTPFWRMSSASQF